MSVADLQYLDFPLIFDYILTIGELENEEDDPIDVSSKAIMLNDAAKHIEECYKQGMIDEKEYQNFLTEWRESCARI